MGTREDDSSSAQNQALASDQTTTEMNKLITCREMDGSGGVDAALCVRAQHCEPVGRVLYL